MAKWRSRIVGHGEEAPDQLLANPMNWRTHPGFQQNALSAVLDDVGIVQNIIVNRRTGHLVDGHLRVMLAMRSEQAMIPVVYVDLDEAEEAKILATLDPIGALAQTDQEILDGLLAGVNGSSNPALEKLLNKLKSKTLTPTKEIKGNTEFKVEVGETWACGEHRVICGDCLNPQLVGWAEYSVCITDPPYVVAYEKKERHDTHKPSRARDAFKESQLTVEQVLGFVQTLGTSMLVMTFPIGRHFHVLAEATKGWVLKELFWKKNTVAFDVNARYQQSHECVLVFSKGKGVWNVPSNQGTVFDIDKPRSQDHHPTEKPLELWEKLVQYHSNPGQVVYDPFLGSGTTLLACEMHGRKCIGVEIEPEYVSLALSKWQTLTGKTPELCKDVKQKR